MKPIIIAVFFIASVQIATAQSLHITLGGAAFKTTDFHKVSSSFYPYGLKYSFYPRADYSVPRQSEGGAAQTGLPPAKAGETYIPYDYERTKELSYKQEDMIPIIASPYMFYLYYTDINNDITRDPGSR